MTTPRRLLQLFPVVLLVALAIPASAGAQASRTWVSGVGDDANPCSRTAPCKTFAGAISKTAAKGEINCLDPGGFGGVTINKSLTIDCEQTEGGALVAGTNAIVVNAGAADTVVLRGLDINGLGSGLNGVRFLNGKRLKINQTKIYGFVRNGIDIEPSTAFALTTISNTRVADNFGNGVLVAPPNAGNGARALVRNSEIEHNGCGIASTTFGPDPAFNFAAACGTASSASGISAIAQINAFHSAINDNSDVGVWSRGNKSTVRIGDNDIIGNNNGLFAADAGAQLLSYGDNRVAGNNNNGAPTGPATTLKRHAKKRKRH